MTDKLSPDELKVIASTLVEHSQPDRFSYKFERKRFAYLLDGWKSFVHEVEEGYALTIYDYTNDLSVRNLLENFLLQMPPTVRDRLLTLIQVYDRRFEEATQEIEQALRGDKTREKAFWDYRIPKQLEEDLKADLQSEGIIP